MTKRIVVYGSGGHGKVVADILQTAGHTLAGFVDDDPRRANATVLGLPVLGNADWLRREKPTYSAALGIGDNRARAAVARRLEEWGIELLTAVHPSAIVARSARLGPGCVVMALAAINADAEIGTGAIVNTGAVIEHDVVIGDFAHASPNAVLGGGARLGVSSHLGIGATVLPEVCIGEGTTVGGGAVVVRDVPSHVIALGVPARVTRAVTH